MRIQLIVLLTICAFLQVGAVSYAQKITLSKRNATLSNIFREIQAQSDYDFIYSNHLIKKAFYITIW